MSSDAIREPIAGASPRVTARLAGVFWLLTILAGALALVGAGGRLAANLVATVCYVVATLLVYALLKAVNRKLSLLAACSSLVGCALGTLIAFRVVPSLVNPLVFFGLHCLMVGYLILRSTFLPRAVGALMVFGGLGWLTFVWPPLATDLFPYNLAPGVLGEGTLTVWLLAKSVNEERWKEQASAAVAG